VLSQGSESAKHNIVFDIDKYCVHQLFANRGGSKRNTLREAFLEMPDIAEDDSDPDIVVHFLEIGISFSILKNIRKKAFMRVFYGLHLDSA